MSGMFKVGSAVTNQRVVADETAQIIATPTNGNIRLNKTLVDKMGVNDLNYIVVKNMTDGEGKPAVDENGNAYLGIFVSKYGLQRNEKGEIIGEMTKDEETGKEVFEPSVYILDKANLNEDRGQKLGYSNGISGSMQFASRSSWVGMGGDTAGSRIYDVPGLQGGEDAADWIVEDKGAKVYVIRFNSFEKKPDIKKKETTDAGTDTAAE